MLAAVMPQAALVVEEETERDDETQERHKLAMRVDTFRTLMAPAFERPLDPEYLIEAAKWNVQLAVAVRITLKRRTGRC